MPATDQRRAIGWSGMLRILALVGWSAIVGAAVPGDSVAQDLGGQGPASQAESGPDLGTGGHPEVKAAARKAIAAEKEFIARTKDVYKTGGAPRQADAAFAPLLDAVFDVAILRRTNVSEEDGDALAQWLRAAIHVGAVYVRAGTGASSLTELASNAKAREQSDRNVSLYAPEIGRFMDGEIVLETALLGTVFKDGSDAGDVKLGEAKDQMRAGLQMTVMGLLRTLVAPGVGYDWRLDRLAVLEAAAPQITKILDPGRCGQLRKETAAISAKLRDSRVTEKLAAFGRKLNCAKA